MISPQPLHNPPSATASFSDPDIIRQRHVARKLQREREHFDAFVRHPALVFLLEQFHVDGLLRIEVELVEQTDELVLEYLFEKIEAFHHARHAGVERVVILVEADPVADMVAKGLFPDAEIILFHVEPGDAYRRAAAVEQERPVGLGKEMMEFFDAFVDAHEHRATVVLFVLNKREPVVKTAGVVVVVVEQFVFPAGLAGHGAAEGAEFPGFNRGVESDG